MSLRVAVVGALVGRNPGHVTTQGEKLADLLRAHGHEVVETSSQLSRPRRLAEIVWTLLRRARDYDTLIVQTYSGLAFVVADVASALGRRLGKQIVLSLHGGNLPEMFVARRAWARRVLERADLIVAPSPFLQRAARSLGFDATIVPNVADLPGYQFRPRARIGARLFWMRAFHEVYAPEVAVRTLAELRRSHPEATLVMAGPDKGTMEATRRLVDELGLTDAVRFAGFLDLAGKQREADAADVFLHTSRVDNTPVVLLEAASLGLPIVGTRVGGIPDFVEDGKTAILVDKDDHRALADAVRRLLADRDLVARLSHAGHTLASGSSPDRVVTAWHSLLKLR